MCQVYLMSVLDVQERIEVGGNDARAKVLRDLHAVQVLFVVVLVLVALRHIDVNLGSIVARGFLGILVRGVVLGSPISLAKEGRLPRVVARLQGVAVAVRHLRDRRDGQVHKGNGQERIVHQDVCARGDES